MGLKLLEVKSEDDFLPLWKVFRDAFADPGNALWPLFTGDWQPHNEAAREAALKESCARFISWHKADPTSTWLQVVDDDTDEILAGGRWGVHTAEKPYDGHGPMEALWWPEGEPRRLATKFLNVFLATASKNANHPHIFLNILFTAPQHRRKGAASLIMDWGFQKARELNLPVYIEATKEGKPVYEKYGCKAIEESTFDFGGTDLPPTNDPQLRQAVIQQLRPFTWWSMVGNASG